MKKDSDNFRTSSILDVIDMLKEQGNMDIIIYEPLLEDKNFEGIPVINDVEEFKRKSDLILANRKLPELKDVEDKVYTKDLFNNN